MTVRSYEELVEDESVRALIVQSKISFPGKRFRPVDTAAGVLILMNPSKQQHEMILRVMIGDKDGPVNIGGTVVMLQTVCAYPDKATLSKLLEEWPGIAQDKSVQESYNILAGQTQGDYQK